MNENSLDGGKIFKKNKNERPEADEYIIVLNFKSGIFETEEFI